MKGLGTQGEGATQWINAGEVKNVGWELSLGYRHKLPCGLSWDINGNISKYVNEVTKLPETVAASGKYGGNGVESIVGHPMYSEVGYVADGLFRSQEEIYNHATQEGAGLGRIRYLDIDRNGIVTEADQTWIYDPTPDFTWGLNIYLQYKDWDLSMFWQGVQGVDVNCYDYKTQSDFWSNSYSEVNLPYMNKGIRVLDAWSPANPNSDIPRLQFGDTNSRSRSTRFLTKASYLSLQNLSFGYTLPANLTRKAKIDKVRVFMNATNVWLWSKRQGLDPRTAATSYSYGESSANYYSIMRTISAGVNVIF